jgi:hypothetical protein
LLGATKYGWLEDLFYNVLQCIGGVLELSPL